ncbi:hypothetical protein [Flavobacterium sp. DSP2-3-1]|uniref:hypothetical protein n=1 Tax=Flavobacterium sp. DSP2-3-1 TaxID=2804620 RepID=UPI003CFB3CA1
MDTIINYCYVNALSVTSTCPVTTDALSEHIQTTALAISSGRPKRPMGLKP